MENKNSEKSGSEPRLRTIGSPEYESVVLKVHCPHCYKGYIVRAKEIKDDHPQFQCQSCSTRFWFAFPEALEAGEIVGFPMEWKDQRTQAALVEPPKESPRAPLPAAAQAAALGLLQLNCPKCQTRYKHGQKECFTCGVVFERWAKVMEDGPRAQPLVEKRWQTLLESYSNREIHQEFISLCQKMDELPYALSKYSLILSLQPNDFIAKDMQKQLSALLTFKAERSNMSSGFFSQMRWSTSLFILCGIIIGTGIVLPEWRNLVGAGMALAFTIGGLRWTIKGF